MIFSRPLTSESASSGARIVTLHRGLLPGSDPKLSHIPDFSQSNEGHEPSIACLLANLADCILLSKGDGGEVTVYRIP